ncbi:MAG: GtrA family protein, partial [Bifidobacteriaceae bacterium]|nr:GtrA family protein [Bifidobacteriaceae bacterium]
MQRTIGRFAIIGSFNSLLDICLTYTLGTFVGFPAFWANFISTSICFAISFIANRHWTFQAGSKNLVYHMIAFTVVSLFSGWVIQGVMISLLSAPLTRIIDQLNWGWLSKIPNVGMVVAKLLAISLGMIWNYVFYATLVFGKLGDVIAAHFFRSRDG